MVPHGDRSNVVIEPFLTDQWYVNAKELAKPAIAAVRDGKTKFVPKNWEKTYFNWMENIQPWCISRQLWWGHQIPAWYGPDGKVVRRCDRGRCCRAASASEAVQRKIDARIMRFRTQRTCRPASKATTTEFLWRDEDVLDTWFSSALWPFSTLGWPDETPELKRYYPTTALVTGFDIIFFWVARMMMMGLHFMKRACRSTTSTSTPGARRVRRQDVEVEGQRHRSARRDRRIRRRRAALHLDAQCRRRATTSGSSPQDVEGNRNFATKLWNAARFVEINGAARVAGFDPKSREGDAQPLDRARNREGGAPRSPQAIETYGFNDAAGAAYRFVWNVYCDWYVELAKPLLTGPDGAAKDETRAMAAWALDEILKLLHPFMPFITEELWAVTAEQGPKRASLLALVAMAAARRPRRRQGRSRDRLGDRSGHRHPLGARRDEHHRADPAGAGRRVGNETQARAERWAEFIKRLARVSEISSAASAPQGSVQLVVRGEVAALPLKGVIDLAAERARLAKEMQKADADIARVDAKLNNPKFMERAPEEVVEEEKEKREEAVARKAKIAEALERLKNAS